MDFDSGIAAEDDTRVATRYEGEPEGSRNDEDPIPNLDETLERLEKELIVRALLRTRGNQSKAAKALGITDRIMGLRVRKYALDAKQFRANPQDALPWP